jgi:hypothetical protein
VRFQIGAKNTTSSIPAASPSAVREGNVAAVSAPGVKGAAFKDGKVIWLFFGPAAARGKIALRVEADGFESNVVTV